jgi:hypothetical protein
MGRRKHIALELKGHAPFTAFGALLGLVVMGVVHSAGLDPSASYDAFHILHPAHLLLSSAVTATMFKRHGGGISASVIVGIVGAIVICTLSDVALPYLGGAGLGATMAFHFGLVEHPWIVLLPALTGGAIGALILRWTRCPHAVHVLISTLASLFYLMAFGVVDWIPKLPLVGVVLFVAVWVPCCTSDVVFPHLFARRARHR